MGIGLSDHLDTGTAEHSLIIYTHNYPKIPASRFRQPPTFRQRHPGFTVLREPWPEVHYYEEDYEDEYEDHGLLSTLSLTEGRAQTGQNGGAIRPGGCRQGDHQRNGWYGNNRQSSSFELPNHAKPSQNYMETYGGRFVPKMEGLFQDQQTLMWLITEE